MTREEIEKNRQYQLTGAAINYCRKEYPHYEGEALGEITDAFEAGAEWEHKRLVEKACEWLQENLFKGYDPDNYPMVRRYDIDLEDFIVMKIFRIIRAKKHKVPFREIMWYNYMAMIPKKERGNGERRYIIIFDKDGKLVVEANNGKIIDNGNTKEVKLEGQFEIGATDVGILLAMLREKTIRREGRENWAFGYYHHGSWEIISRDEAIKQLEGIIKDKQVEMLELQAQKARLERLIREHNAKCGIFGKKIEL